MKNFNSMLSKILALLLLIGVAAGAEPAPKRILFVGNSYTGVNKLPDIFKEIVSSVSKDAVEIKSSTPGGRSFLRHMGEKGSLQLIDEGNWDVVVLQGQSQEAAMSERAENVRKDFLEGAKQLCLRIKAKSPAAKIVFYQTWARHADYWRSASAEKTLGSSPADMQARNHKWYQTVATENKGIVAPVGDAWELSYKEAQAQRLHSDDNSHPAFSGSYLAGLVIYGTIYQPQNLTVSYRGSLDAAEATRLQGVATKALKAASVAPPK